MTIVDYDKKIELALDRYDQACELLDMQHDSIRGFHYLYNFDILNMEVTEDINKRYMFDFKTKVKDRKHQLLIELGRVGEYAIKYLLLLKQIKDYPDQSFEEFKQKALYSLADRGVGNTYINQYHMDSNIVENVRIAKDQHPLQPLHDYDYLFTMLKLLYPEIVTDIHTVLEREIKSKIMLDSNLPDELKEKFAMFPQKMYVGINDLTVEEMEQYRSEFERIIRESGDSFARLRYLENNPDNKQYDLNSILDMLDYLIDYIKLVHEINKDDIDKDIEIAYRKDKFIKEKIIQICRKVPRKNYYEYCNEELEKEKQKIDRIFEIDRIKNNISLLEVCAFDCELSTEEIIELSKENITDDELYALLKNNINLENITYFRDAGISNITDIIRAILNKHYDLNKIIQYGFNKEQVQLLVWLDVETINELKYNTNVYDYIINNHSVLKKFCRNYNLTSQVKELFKLIIELPEIKNNPYLLELLDYDQLNILNQLLNTKLTKEEIINNIRNNCQLFANNEILRKLPIMLNANSNKKVYEILIQNGFDESMLASLDSTIFCIPYEIVQSVANFMKEKNIPLIVNGNISSQFYLIIERMRSKVTEEGNINRPVPLRHLGFEENIYENKYSEPNPVDLNINFKK